MFDKWIVIRLFRLNHLMNTISYTSTCIKRSNLYARFYFTQKGVLQINRLRYNIFVKLSNYETIYLCTVISVSVSIYLPNPVMTTCWSWNLMSGVSLYVLSLYKLPFEHIIQWCSKLDINFVTLDNVVCVRWLIMMVFINCYVKMGVTS